MNAITIKAALERYVEMKVLSVSREKQAKMALNLKENELVEFIKKLNSLRLIPADDVEEALKKAKTIKKYESVMITKL